MYFSYLSCKILEPTGTLHIANLQGGAGVGLEEKSELFFLLVLLIQSEKGFHQNPIQASDIQD